MAKILGLFSWRFVAPTFDGVFDGEKREWLDVAEGLASAPDIAREFAQFIGLQYVPDHEYTGPEVNDLVDRFAKLLDAAATEAERAAQHCGHRVFDFFEERIHENGERECERRARMMRECCRTDERTMLARIDLTPKDGELT